MTAAAANLVMNHHSARKHARVIVREHHTSTEWVRAECIGYGIVGDYGCVAFTVRTDDGREFKVAEDRIHLATCRWCGVELEDETDAHFRKFNILFRSHACPDPEHQGR